VPRSRLPRVAALLLAGTLLVAACGGQEPPGGAPASAGEIKVFAAASLTAAFTEFGRRFTAVSGGTRVTFNFAGSQALATQIRQGAPADVFASADVPNMEKVKNLTGDPKAFAGNRLQIVVERGNPKGIGGLGDLARTDLKVVLAAEEVPAGRYADQVLDRAGVRVSPVSREDSVKAVVTKVSLGEADAGIVYATDVRAGGDEVQGVAIPTGQNVTATYPIATVKASRAPDEAQAFLDLVLSDQGRQVLADHGFLPPPTT
jgi:molybdate transport system substrate-binding protein